MKLSYYLIPSEYNEYKPWIISPGALVIFCLIIWGIRLLLPTVSIAAPSIDPSDLMTKINFERTQRFIPALTTNSKLTTAANGKASDMLARSYFDHVDPDGNYVWPRIEATGYTPYSTLGENLAMDFNNADAMVGAWMNSPTHRANIENAKFEDQGLASIYGQFESGHNTIMVASLFGTLYKTKTVTPAPQLTPTPTPVPAPKPTPVPTPTPTPKNTESKIEIFKEAKISSTKISGQILVNMDVVIMGGPTLVTGKLKSQSITLLPGKSLGQYLGSFTFDSGENLNNQTVTIEARDNNAKKVSMDFPVNIENPAVSGEAAPAQTLPLSIPVSNEAQVVAILRIVFGIFAGLYVIFLIVDAIIIHRAKIKRAGIHSSTHTLLFLLIAAVSLFGRL